MKMTTVASSNIKAIGYSEPLKQLHVEFKGGKTFAYADVSKEEFDALTAAPSTGKHFNQHIKAVKKCFEVVEGWQEELIAKQAGQIKGLELDASRWNALINSPFRLFGYAGLDRDDPKNPSADHGEGGYAHFGCEMWTIHSGWERGAGKDVLIGFADQALEATKGKE